jgi:hypothetical protein
MTIRCRSMLSRSAEPTTVSKDAPRSQRKVQAYVLRVGARSHAALAPVYVMAYRYRDRVFPFVANGQNGHATGTALIAATKVFGVITAVVLVVIVIFFLSSR